LRVYSSKSSYFCAHKNKYCNDFYKRKGISDNFVAVKSAKVGREALKVGRNVQVRRKDTKKL